MIEIAADLEDLSQRAARLFAAAARRAVTTRGLFRVALAGGGTPRRTYELLAAEPYRDQVPWPAVEVFWGDERCVPPSDPRSNQRLARMTLLDHVPVPPGRIRPMACVGDPAAAARAYQQLLARRCGPGLPRFDLILLGLGADGHTASLFPDHPALQEERRWVTAVTVPGQDFSRLSLTLPVLNQAAEILFLVAGAEKAPVLGGILSGAAPQLPAARVRPHSGRLRWLVDRAAAGGED